MFCSHLSQLNQHSNFVLSGINVLCSALLQAVTRTVSPTEIHLTSTNFLRLVFTTHFAAATAETDTAVRIFLNGLMKMNKMTGTVFCFILMNCL